MTAPASDNAVRDWGVPDWRDASAYPTPEYEQMTSATPLDLWRWEFRRRRSDLRDDFVRHAPEALARCRAKADDTKSIWYGQKCCVDDPQFFVPVPDCIMRYGYLALPNPALSNPYWRKILWRPTYDHYIESNVPAGASIPLPVFDFCLPRDYVAYTFDLMKPLGPQVEKAKRELYDLQKYRRINVKKRRFRGAENWPKYLRVLDAKDAGATLAEIGKVVLGEKDFDSAAKRAHDAFRMAQALQQDFPVPT